MDTRIRLAIALSLLAAALLCWSALYVAQAIARQQNARINAVEQMMNETQ